MKIDKALEMIERCDGQCKVCKHWRMKFSNVNDHLTVYAHYCNIARRAKCTWYSESLAKLKTETIKLISTEISY